MQLPFDELPGRSVVDATGRVLGEVERLIVDTSRWEVETLRVKLRRQAAETLGLPWNPFRAPTIDVPTAMVGAASDAILLSTTIGDLSNADVSFASDEARAAS